jgi:hypothetical protein
LNVLADSTVASPVEICVAEMEKLSASEILGSGFRRKILFLYDAYEKYASGK